MIIGLSGYARTGKDTFAEWLVDKYGFKRIGFADVLRECLYALNPVVGVRYIPSSHSNYLVRLQEVIDQYGWDNYKSTVYGDEIRALLQRLGTEVGRGILGEDIWVDTALRFTNDENNYVISDCRFRNEALAIKKLGGSVIRIERAGFGPVNDHISEVGLDDWDFDATIHNNGTSDEYHSLIDSLMLSSKALQGISPLLESSFRFQS